MKLFKQSEKLRKAAIARTLVADELRSLLPKIENSLQATGQKKSTHDLVAERELARSLFSRKEELEEAESQEEQAKVKYRSFVKEHGNEISKELLDQFHNSSVEVGIDWTGLEAGLKELQTSANVCHKFAKERGRLNGTYGYISLRSPWGSQMKLGAPFTKDLKNSMLRELFASYLGEVSS